MEPSAPPGNPFDPPRSELDAPPVGGEPLFSPRQMGVASFLASPIAGVVMLRANYRSMGNARLAKRTLVIGGLACAVMVALLMLLPERVPGTPINIVAALVFNQLAQALQGTAYRTHLKGGGARRSNWAVLGIMLGCFVVIGGVMLGVGLLVTD